MTLVGARWKGRDLHKHREKLTLESKLDQGVPGRDRHRLLGLSFVLVQALSLKEGSSLEVR